MRIAEIILLLLLVLIGFGFLLDHSLNLTQELRETRAQLASIQAELGALEGQYQAVLEEKNRLTEQISGLTGENASLRARVEALEAERVALIGQIGALQRKLALIENRDRLPSWPGSTSIGRVAALLVLPIVPVTFGAIYVMTHQKAPNRLDRPTPGRASRMATFHATLTREELHFIARRRRARRDQQQTE